MEKGLFRGNLIRVLCAALCGVAASLGFFFPLAYIWTALGFLGLIYLLVEEKEAKKGAFLSYVFGLGYFATGLSWVFKAVYVYGNAPWLFAFLSVLALAAVLSIFAGVVGFLAVKIPLPISLKASLLIPLLWVASEFLRGEWICSFGWLTVGYAFIDSLFASYAPIFGAYGITLAVLCTVGGAAAVLMRTGSKVGRTVAGFISALIVLGAYGLSDVNWSEPASKLEVRLIQPDLPVTTRATFSAQIASLERVRAMSVASPMGSSLDLIIWPESVYMALPRFLPENLRNVPKEVAKLQDSEVLYNAFTEPEKGKIGNSLILATPEGEKVIYSKRHLVPFGERVPFGFRWLINALGIPMADQTAGATPSGAIQIAGKTAALGICYENLFAGELRDWFKASNPEVIIYTANLGWFSECASFQFTQMSRMRAKESARVVLQTVNNGGSAVIGAKGEILREAKAGAQNLDASLRLTQGELTPFMQYGFWTLFGLGIFFFFVIVAFCTFRRHFSRKSSA